MMSFINSRNLLFRHTEWQTPAVLLSLCDLLIGTRACREQLSKSSVRHIWNLLHIVNSYASYAINAYSVLVQYVYLNIKFKYREYLIRIKIESTFRYKLTERNCVAREERCSSRPVRRVFNLMNYNLILLI